MRSVTMSRHVALLSPSMALWNRKPMLFSYPLMAAIQEISGRIGRTTGRGIAGNIRRHYPAWLLHAIVGLLFIANTINIGADLGAMGDALSR